MKKLTDIEEKIMLGMNIYPNLWQDNGKFPPDAKQILAWCSTHGLKKEVRSEEDAERILQAIHDKTATPDSDDGISLEDTAAWILSKSFSREQLLGMSDEEIIEWLQNWKYYFGFRKKEGWGSSYKASAIAVLDGEMELADDPDNDLMYVCKD